jgi:hypothetical protein
LLGAGEIGVINADAFEESLRPGGGFDRHQQHPIAKTTNRDFPAFEPQFLGDSHRLRAPIGK